MALGSAYLSSDRLGQAKDHLEAGFSLAQKISDAQAQAQACLSLSIVFEKRADFKTAVKKAEKALQIAQNGGMQIAEMGSYSRLGEIHFELGHADEGMQCCEKGLAIGQKTANMQGIAAFSFLIGKALLADGRDLERCIELFQLVCDQTSSVQHRCICTCARARAHAWMHRTAPHHTEPHAASIFILGCGSQLSRCTLNHSSSFSSATCEALARCLRC